LISFNLFPDFGHTSSLSAEAIMKDAKATQMEAKDQPGLTATLHLLISSITLETILENNVKAI
jgi:hypothetical protein